MIHLHRLKISLKYTRCRASNQNEGFQIEIECCSQMWFLWDAIVNKKQ